MRWTRYDKQGFSVAWCELERERWYFHVRHSLYGVRFGFERSQVACHRAANWIIGDMRQGLT